MIKELRLAIGRGDAKAHVQMEKKTWQSENWEESKARTKVRSLWSDVCLLYLWKKKIHDHDDVVIRIRNKYNQAFNLRLRYKQQTLQYLQILSLETFRDAA